MPNLNWEEPCDCGDDMFPNPLCEKCHGEGVVPIVRWLNSNLEAFLAWIVG